MTAIPEVEEAGSKADPSHAPAPAAAAAVDSEKLAAEEAEEVLVQPAVQEEAVGAMLEVMAGQS